MAANRELHSRWLGIFCILLALLCLFLGFLPFSHHCGETECAVCSIIEGGGVACILVHCAFFYRSRIISNQRPLYERCVTALEAYTLVGYKVKLSD